MNTQHTHNLLKMSVLYGIETQPLYDLPGSGLTGSQTFIISDQGKNVESMNSPDERQYSY